MPFNIHANETEKTATSSYRLMPLIAFFFTILAVSIYVAYVGRQKAEPFLFAFMSILALIGIWAIFLYIGGWIGQVQEPVKQDNFSALMDFPQAIVMSDLNLIISAKNTSFTRTFGDKKTIYDIFSGDQKNADKLYRLVQSAQKGLSQSEDLTYENTAIRLTSKLKNQSLLWLIEDRSKEQQQQDAAFQNAKQAFQLLDEAPAGIFVAQINGDISFINQTLAHEVGIDLGAFNVKALTVQDVFPPSFLPIFQNALRLNEPQQKFDGFILSKDKKEIPVTIIIKIVENGTNLDIFGHISPRNEISTLKTSSDKASSWFQTFFDHSPLGLVIVNAKADILKANTSFMVLQNAVLDPKTDHKNLISFVVDASKIEISQAIRQVSLSRKAVIIDAPFHSPSKRWGKFYISPLEVTENSEEAAFIYVIDTSEQKSLQEQFAQSQKMQAVGVLAGGVAHDFNNVLQAIIGNSDLLLMNMRTTDMGFQEVREIKSNANRAASLVRQLLAFSRQQTLRAQTLQINDLIHDMNALIKRSIAEKMKLITNYGRDVWTIRADVTQLEQVVLNLAVNARDAMPNGGSLTITTTNVASDQILSLRRTEMPTVDYVLLEVQDTGTGMPQNVIDKIFEPFFTTKELGKGTGLGLSQVFGIIKQSGGFVYVDSIEGQGTTFKIFFPRFIETEQTPAVTIKDAPKDAVKEKPAPVADMTGAGTILYVEDEIAVRTFGVRALTARGYTVLQAESGVEALEIFEEVEGKVDLVISDVVMPEMDGPTLLGELRRRNPKLKVIFASGYAEEAFSKNLPEGEEFHFLAKPFQMATLIKTVKDVISS